MLAEVCSLSWQDRLEMEITNCLATINVTPIISLNPQTFQTVVLQAMKRMIKANAPEILEHGEQTAHYALSIGNEIGLSGDELADLRYAALLHDIGKLTLPKEILDKKRPLTADEYALVQSHPRAGAELLEPICFLHTPAVWIAHHHERWDGSGYPYGVRGEFIPLGARILAVADTFDALTANASYGRCQSWESALRLLGVGAGTQLDPGLVEVFVGLAPGVFAETRAVGASDIG